MIKETKFKVQKTARFFSLGEINGKTKRVWFVLHGYGQLAKNFLREFESLLDEETIIIAPEALSKFYFRGLNGNIGASWMTKEDRESEIEDYINFLDNIYREILNEINKENLEILVLGFSQGCHTAVRWLEKSKFFASQLILCSGTFPEDARFKEKLEYWNKVNITTVTGLSDRLVDHNVLADQIAMLKNNNIEVNAINFDGGHKLESGILQNI